MSEHRKKIKICLDEKAVIVENKENKKDIISPEKIDNHQMVASDSFFAPNTGLKSAENYDVLPFVLFAVLIIFTIIIGKVGKRINKIFMFLLVIFSAFIVTSTRLRANAEDCTNWRWSEYDIVIDTADGRELIDGTGDPILDKQTVENRLRILSDEKTAESRKQVPWATYRHVILTNSPEEGDEDQIYDTTIVYEVEIEDEE